LSLNRRLGYFCWDSAQKSRKDVVSE